MFIVKTDKELIDYIPIFLENRMKDIIELQRSITENNLKKFKMINHDLKGICLPFGFVYAHELVHGIEKYYGNIEKMQDFVNKLKNYFENVQV